MFVKKRFHGWFWGGLEGDVGRWLVGVQSFHRKPPLPQVKLAQRRFADAGLLGDAIAGQAGIIDSLPQLVSQLFAFRSLLSHIQIIAPTVRFV